MSDGAALTRPPGAAWRRALGIAGLGVAILACVPDLAGIARGSEVAQSLSYALMAMVAPALIAIGVPWSTLSAHGTAMRRPIERLGTVRADRRGLALCLGVLVLDLVVIVWWRTPVLVDALARHPALVLAESATLCAAGTVLWLELVEAAPLVPRSSRPRRAVLAALAMWTVWSVAYLEGMSSTGWYHAFHHVAGIGLSAAAERELSAALIWAVAAVVFMPVVFSNLFRWLRAESQAGTSEGGARPALGPVAGSLH